MSLLDDVSIVVTPNGYKAGELYAVIPTPSEGAELVPSIASIVNAGGGTLTQISGNSYSSTSDGTTGSAIRPKLNLNLTAGKRYKLTITPTGTISGTVNFDFYDGSSYLFQNYDFTTTKEIYFIDNGSVFGAFDGTQTYDISSFTVSVKEYTSADMDVTRATAATRVDEDGLVNYADIIGDEELTNGDFSGGSTGWTLSGAWSLGTNKVIFSDTSNGDIRTSTAIFTATKTYQIKLTVADLTGSNTAFFGIGDGSASNLVGYDNYANGDYTFNIIAPNGSGFRIYSTTSSGSSYSITNISIKEVTRDNVPRIDYTGGGCPHILAEPQRTNVSTYSEDFSQSFYIKDSGVSVGTTNNISPSGESNATQIEVNNNGRIYANVASDTYSSSVFIKAGTFAYFKFGGSNIDLEAGTYSGGTIESFGNGWFRITKAYTGNRPFQIQAYPDGTYSTHTTYGNYYIWGAQLEVGSYPTSYIPTSGSTVTRNQDIFTRDGIGSLINSTEGTLVIEPRYFINDGDATGRKISISDGTGTNRIYITPYQGLASRIRYIFTNGGVTQADLQVTGIDITVSRKLAFVWATNRFELWQNGYKISEDTSGATPSAGTFNQIHFGSETGNGTELFEGELKQLQVYTTALSDDQIRQITQ